MKKKHHHSAWATFNPTAPGPLPPALRRRLSQYLNQEVNAYAKPRQQAITRYTKGLAAALQGIAPQISDAYGQAQSAQGTLDQALSDRLQAGIGGAGDQLASALGSAGQDVHPANQIRQDALGAGATSFAQGSAGLGALIGQGAAQQAYGAKLPGIAALGGLQSSKQLGLQAEAMIPDLRKAFLDNELQKWIARTGLGTDRANLRLNRTQERNRHNEFLASLNLDNQKFIYKQYQDQIDAKSQGKADKLKAIDGALSDAIAAAEKWKSSSGGSTGGGLVPGSGSSGGLSPSAAYDRVKSRLEHALRRYGVSPKKVRSMVLYVLRQAGYKTSDFGGQPHGSGGPPPNLPQ